MNMIEDTAENWENGSLGRDEEFVVVVPNYTPTLFIVRGLPGSGKSTLANKVCSGPVFEADDYFYDDDGIYNFDRDKLAVAHQECLKNTESEMRFKCVDVAVANTFTQEWEIEPYLNLAKKYGYQVQSIIVENRHGNESVHDVPVSAIERMKSRFSVKL